MSYRFGIQHVLLAALLAMPVLAWVANTLLTTYGEQETEKALNPPGPIEYVQASTLNVRAGPGTEHRVIGKVDQNRAVVVLEERGDWKRITIPAKDMPFGDREDGWVAAKHLAVPSVHRVKLAVRQREKLQSAAPAEPSRPSRPSFCGETSLEDLSAVIYKLERERRRAYVTGVWYGLPIDQKEALTLYFSECHGLTHVIDAMSGKEVATHRLTGVRVYQ